MQRRLLRERCCPELVAALQAGARVGDEVGCCGLRFQAMILCVCVCVGVVVDSATCIGAEDSRTPPRNDATRLSEDTHE